jgi:spermidine synthase
MRPRTLLPLLFLSGAAALILEVAWFRRTAQVAGGTALAMAAVLAAVIGGMALGSFLLGRVADRVRSPLRLYGWLECGIAVSALLTPPLLGLSAGVHAGLTRALGDAPVVLMAARFLVATVLLAPPAILMGGTLPAMAAALRASPESRGAGIGALYGANTLGAVVGTLLAGFLLLPTLGLAATTWAAALPSGLAGFVALLMARRGSAETREGEAVVASPEPDVPAADARRAVLLYAVSGFLGLVAEVAFTRSLVLVFGSTTYAFSMMLAVFLLGIGAGSLIGTRLARRPGRQLSRLATTLAATAALFALAGLVVYALPRLYLQLYLALGEGFTTGLLLRVLLAALVLLPGSLGLGIAFPLAAHLAAGARAVGDGTGRLYAANTLASICGSTLAVFVLVPTLGPQIAVAAVAIAAGAIAVFVQRKVLVGALAAVTLVGLVSPTEPARERLLAGVYFQPSAFLSAGEIDEESWSLGADIGFVRYGHGATVAIWNWGGRPSLLVDGKAVASSQVLADDHHLMLLGHLPMLVHPSPTKALVVGLGMGTTYRAVAAHEPSTLRVVEIEDAVVEAAAELGIRPRDVVVEDARTYLRATREKFDVITSDPIHPWVRGGGDLYTREYFLACRERLNPRGVVCQWLPVYQMGVEDLRDVIRTFTSVFRAAAYYGGGDLVLVGTAEDAVPTPRPFPGDVEPVLEAELEVLRVADHDALVAAAGEGPLLTDDSLRLEFSAPRQMESPELAACFAWIRALWGSPLIPYADLLDAQRLLQEEDGAGAQAHLEHALRQRPGHGFTRRFAGETYLNAAEDLAFDGQAELSDAFLASARKLLGEDPRLLDVEARIAAHRGETERAAALLRRLVERFPESRYLRRRLARLAP